MDLTALATQILKLITLLLEGVPIEQRRATAITWFWLNWPLAKLFLKMGRTPQDVIDQIEAGMKQASVDSTPKVG